MPSVWGDIAPGWIDEDNAAVAAQAARDSASERTRRSIFQPSGLMERAQAQYPVLAQSRVPFANNLGRSSGYLESWAAGEPGSSNFPRPPQLPMDQFGVENYRADTKPIDVLGDVVSHHLINTDPRLKQTYSDFVASVEPWQRDRLREQYNYAKTKLGEARPYDAWEKDSGLPAYFRGRPFQQWKNSDDMYTQQQRKMLDGMMRYLGGGGTSTFGSLAPRGED